MESGLSAYESIVPKTERNLPLLTLRKIVSSYRVRRRDVSKRSKDNCIFFFKIIFNFLHIYFNLIGKILVKQVQI